ncbi:hypothetical protein FACS1894102_7440 [Spirochaetia bacterium]|nr:hypothetical protein FACS1894102_7440 [Spirochaetia bacterium]
MQLYAGTYNKEVVKGFVRGAAMPCVAKKMEGARSEFKSGEGQHIGFVLSSQEIVRMIKEAGIDYANIKPALIEEKWRETTGAAVIFGVSGGVMEAALRYAAGALDPKNAEALYKAIAESGVRGIPKPDAKAGALVEGIKTLRPHDAGNVNRR